MVCYKYLHTTLNILQRTVFLSIGVIATELYIPQLAREYDQYGILVGMVLGSIVTVTCFWVNKLRALIAYGNLEPSDEAVLLATLAIVIAWCILALWVDAPAPLSVIWTDDAFCGAFIAIVFGSFFSARQVWLVEQAARSRVRQNIK
jgi:hypothetical protein